MLIKPYHIIEYYFFNVNEKSSKINLSLPLDSKINDQLI